MRKLENKLRRNVPPDDRSQLENLKNYRILYNRSELVFDQLAAYTAKILNVPLALINFVDQESAWIKEKPQANLVAPYRTGTNLCSMAVLRESGMKVEDFEKKPYLLSNALIVGEAGFQFYAAVPITTDEGFIVGTVCIVDQAYRKLLPHEQKQLECVAGMVKKEMNKKMARYELV